MTLSLPEPVLTARLFPHMLAELLALLSGFTDEEWQQPTACAAWSVKEVALHLLGGEIGNLSRRRDRHNLGGSIHSAEELLIFINDWNQNWVHAAQRISPRLLIDLLQHTGVQMNTYFQSLDPYPLGDPISWVGPEPAPVWLDVAREYTERWHHQQHIRDAVGKPGLKQPEYFAPALAAFAFALPRAYQSMPADENTVATLTIQGSSGGSWSVRREQGKWNFYTGRPDRPDAETILDEEIAWRLFTRGITPRLALEQTTSSGNRPLALKVLEMVSIIA